jgi:hypothetical protein
LQRIPNYNTQNFSRLKGQRIPKLYKEQNTYQYISERPQTLEYEPNSYHYSSKTPERPEYGSNTETTPYSHEDSEPIPPSHHYGGDGIEVEPEHYSKLYSLNNRPLNHPFPYDKYHESASNSPPLEVVSNNNEQNNKKHKNNNFEDNNYGDYDDYNDIDSDGRNKSKITAQKPNVNSLRQLFLPQTEVSSEIHTLYFQLKSLIP